MTASSTDLTGRVCVVTGASAGIGAETAVGLARLGAEVAVVGRDNARTGQVAVRCVEARGTATAFLADFAKLSDVHRLAADLLATYPQIHVLVNNAGLIQRDRVVTDDGFESTFAVNHLAPYLLTRLLLSRLEDSAPARVVNVSSIGHRGGRIDFDDLNRERRSYDRFRAYNDSKLANVLFTNELARRTEGTGVTANVLHPGPVKTSLFRDSGFIRNAQKAIPFFLDAKGGARTSIWLASAPEAADLRGAYVVRCKPHQASARGRNDDTARRLWDVSAELVGLPA